MTGNTRNTGTSNLPPVDTEGKSRRGKKKVQLPDLGGCSRSELDEYLGGLSEDCRNLYLLLSRKFDDLVGELRNKDAKLEEIESENRVLREKLNHLESRVDDIDNQNRCRNLVLSGNALKNISNDNLTNSAIQLLRGSVQYELAPDKVLATYRVGARSPTQSPDGRGLMIKLRDEDVKRDILSACRTVRPPGLYANDDLTPYRAKILFILRKAKNKSDGKLTACGSQNGNVYAFLKPSNGARSQKDVHKNNA